MQDIHGAAYNGDLDEVKRLLKLNPLLAKAKNEWGRTPIHYSAANVVDTYRYEITKLLLKHGASPNTRDEHNRTPLIEATTIGCPEVVKLLIEKRANLEVKDRLEGRTALLWAGHHLRPEVIEVLVKAGANTNVKDKSGLNLLHVVAVSPGFNVLKELGERNRYLRLLNLLVSVMGEDVVVSALEAQTNDGYSANHLLDNRSVVFVRSYERRDGTRVRAHFRNKPGIANSR